ncbi:hypothetical protein BJ165DRAFT_1508283 [Panaeolus papilionaceus]|nr:hypothetical protein BJ165DRAFT_1508283 [Panaeolus papilionaceus]
MHSSSSSHYQSHFPPLGDAYPHSSAHAYHPNPPHSHSHHTSRTYHSIYSHSMAHHIPPNPHVNTSPATLSVSSRTPDSNESSYRELAFQLQSCHDEFERIQDVQERRVEEVRRAREEEELRQREARQRQEEWMALRSAVDVDEDGHAREERAAFLRAMSEGASSVGGVKGVVVGKGKGKAKEEDVKRDDGKGKGKGKQRATTLDAEVTVAPTQQNAPQDPSIVSMLDEDEIEADHVASLVVDMVNREADLEDAAMDVDLSGDEEEGIDVSRWLQRTESEVPPSFDVEMDDTFPPSWPSIRAQDNGDASSARRGEPQPGDLTYGTQFTLSPYAQALMNRGPRSSLGGLDRVRESGEGGSKERRNPKTSLSDTARKEVLFMSLRKPSMTQAGQAPTLSFTPRNSNVINTAPFNTIHPPPATSSDPVPDVDDDESDDPTFPTSADTQMGRARISLDDFVLRMKSRKTTARGEASSSATNPNTTSSNNPTGSTPWQLDTESPTTSLNRYIAHLTSPTSTTASSLSTNIITNPALPFNFAAPEPPLTFPQYTQPTPSYTTPTPEDERLRTEDLQDYLFGWNRFCRNLRYVEIGVEGAGSGGLGGSEDGDAGGGGGAGKDGAPKDGKKNQGWSRRFEGDGWEFGRNWDGWDK